MRGVITYLGALCAMIVFSPGAAAGAETVDRATKKRRPLFMKAQLLREEAPVRVAHRVNGRKRLSKALHHNGFGLVEVDVQLTADNVLVAGWGNVRGDKRVGELTLKEIRDFGRQGLTLDEIVAEASRQHVGVHFDLQDFSADIEGYTGRLVQRVQQLLLRHGMAHHAFFTSFDPKIIEALNGQWEPFTPRLATALTLPRNAKLPVALRTAIEKAKGAGATYLSIYPEQLEHAPAIRESGLRIIRGLSDAKWVPGDEHVDLVLVEP